MKTYIKFFLKYKEIIFLILLGLIPITWFESDFINGSDFCFPMADTNNVLYNYAHIWLDKVGLGFTNSRAIPQLSFFLLFTLANNIGISPQICERILFFMLFSLSGIGMYFLVNMLAIEKNKKLISLSAALFYMFNTFNIIFYWHILDGMIFCYTVFIISLVLYLKWYKEKKMIFLILFNIVSIFGGYTFSNPIMIPIFWITMIIFNFIIADFSKEKFSDFLKFNIINIIIWTAINLWWFLPLIGSIKEEYSGLSATIGDPYDTLKAFSLNSSFLNLFRVTDLYWAFTSNLKGDPFYTYAAVYSTPVFKIISFLIPVLIFMPLIPKNKSKIVVVISAITLIYLFLAKGVHFPFGETFYKLFNIIPFMNAFRAPIHKLGVLICINYAILLGFGISVVYSFFYYRSKYLAYLTILSLYIVLFVIFPYPMWTGEVIHRGGIKYPSFHTKVPEYYGEAEKWLNRDKGDFRIAAIPVSPTLNTVYRWDNGYIGSDPSFNLFSKPGIFTTTDPTALLPYTILRDTMSNEVWKILRLLNVKYMLLHRDINDELLDIFTDKYKKASYLEDRLKTQNEVKLEKSFGDLDFYKISDKYFLPHIYATSNITPVFGNVNSFKSLISTDYVNEASTIIFSEGNKNSDFHKLLNLETTDKFLLVDSKHKEKRVLLNNDSLNDTEKLETKKSEFNILKDGLYSIDVKLTPKYIFNLENEHILNVHLQPDNIETKRQRLITDEINLTDLKKEVYYPLNTISCAYKINWGSFHGNLILTRKFNNINLNENRYLIINYEIDKLFLPDIEIYVWVKKDKKSIRQKMLRCNNILPYSGKKYKIIFFSDLYNEVRNSGYHYLSRIDILIKKPETKQLKFTIHSFNLSKEFFSLVNTSVRFYDDRYIRETNEEYNYENINNIHNTEWQNFINVNEQPILDFYIKKYNSSENEIDEVKNLKFKFNLDFNNDMIPDDNFEFIHKIESNFFQINLYKEIKNIFRGKKYYNLTSIDIFDFKGKKITTYNVSVLKLKKYIKRYNAKLYPENTTLKIDDKISQGKFIKDKYNNFIFKTNSVRLNKGKHILDILTDQKFTMGLLSINVANNSSLENPIDVSFKKINPSKYEVNANAKNPFILVFSESFHPGWSAFINNEKIKTHFVVNGYANGFFIEKAGKFNITIKYTSQYLFYIGVIFSSITFLSLIGYIVIKKK